MNQMEIFKNPEFGAIRAVEIDGEPWLVGKDVSLALGYTNPQKAIRDHVDAEDRTVNDSFTVNGTAITLINESGLYSLVLSSKLPKAKQFRRWVTSEVLPTIRMFWTNPDCPSVCNRRTARNADEKQARTPRKTVLPVRRNNVAFQVDMRSKCRVCIRCFDRNCIRQYNILSVSRL